MHDDGETSKVDFHDERSEDGRSHWKATAGGAGSQFGQSESQTKGAWGKTVQAIDNSAEIYCGVSWPFLSWKDPCDAPDCWITGDIPEGVTLAYDDQRREKQHANDFEMQSSNINGTNHGSYAESEGSYTGGSDGKSGQTGPKGLNGTV